MTKKGALKGLNSIARGENPWLFGLSPLGTGKNNRRTLFEQGLVRPHSKSL